MHVKTSLSSELINAYEATNFHVKTDPAFILKIGNQSTELGKIYGKYSVNSATFITAFNPFSHTLNDDGNRNRNLELKSELDILNLMYLDGIGQDPLGKWPGEESFLVLGINYESALRLGNKYEQNAVVWCDLDAIPKLILLR